ncbi:Kyphoscoliosis [Brachionus plicatilis]|uniref:Kyphoscoliosis n=1 Tax=Brachionus plicatilis TaxID=10195 RepID=A0A3M7S9L2_BRAPC|nr:Kyphoscoliosis [Brachionus plicatilis]
MGCCCSKQVVPEPEPEAFDFAERKGSQKSKLNRSKKDVKKGSDNELEEKEIISDLEKDLEENKRDKFDQRLDTKKTDEFEKESDDDLEEKEIISDLEKDPEENKRDKFDQRLDTKKTDEFEKESDEESEEKEIISDLEKYLEENKRDKFDQRLDTKKTDEFEKESDDELEEKEIISDLEKDLEENKHDNFAKELEQKERFEINEWIEIIDFLSSKKDLESYVFSIKKSKVITVQGLAEYINHGPARSNLEKYWMIFLWITENIAYNTLGYRSGNLGNNSADYVFQSGLAVCEGFSNLFSAICEFIGLECIWISGFAKGDGYKIGDTFDNTNHAWNVIKVEGKFYYVDSTWSCRHNNYDTTEKDWNPYWFMTPPNIFLESHFSPDIKLHRKSTKEEFERMHFFRLLYHIYGFKSDQIESSSIEATSNPFCVEFTSVENCDLLVNLEDFVTKSKINDAVILQKDSTHSSFRYCIIIFTESKFRKYGLKIFAKKSNSQSTSYSLLTELILIPSDKSKVKTKHEMKKLIPAYNLTYMENKIKVMSHKRSLIYLDTDKLVMEFEMDKSLEPLFELKTLQTKVVVKDAVLVQKESHRTNTNKFCLIILFPIDKKEFLIQLFAKHSDSEQNTFDFVTDFKLILEEVPRKLNWKEIEHLIPAYNLTFLDNKIRLVSHNRVFISYDSKVLEMEFEVDKSVEMMAKLNKIGDPNEIQGSTLVQKDPKKSRIKVYVSCHEADRVYRLTLYSKNFYNNLFHEFANLNLMKKGLTEKISFLTKYGSERFVFVHAPIYSDLNIGTKYTFKYYVESAKVVFLSLGKKEIYLDECENEPNIFEIDFQPHQSGDLNLCAKFEYGNSYSILCKYKVKI